MIYDVTHRTTIAYADPVSLAQFNVRLRPAPWPGQSVTDFSLTVDPTPTTQRDGLGAFYVNESRLTLVNPISALTIETRFHADVAPLAFDPAAVASPSVRDLRQRALTLPDLGVLAPASYLFTSPIAAPEPEIAGWAGPLIDDDAPVIAAGAAIMAAIHREFRYASDATKTDTPPIEAFRKRHGVCQDFTHIMIIAARAHGVPAAYVSGYLRTYPPPGRPRLVGADAMHAWAALWCGDDLGWIGFDPTNDVFAGEDHIFVALGRDYGDVAPLDGVLRGGGGQAMTVSVDVAPQEN